MNKIYKYVVGVFTGLLALASCSPDDFDGANGNVPNAADYEDNVVVYVDQETNNAYFEFKSAPGVTPVWIIDGTTYKTDFKASKYYRKAGDYTVECKIMNRNGISDGSIVKTFTVNKTVMVGFGGFDANSDKNLFKNTTLELLTGFYAPDWNQIADAQVTMSGNDFSVKLPVATKEKWQAQVPFSTGIGTTQEDGVTYDFSCILTSNKDHGNITIKLTNSTNNNDFYFEEKQAVKAGEPVCFYMTELPSRNIENLTLVFDFGGNAEGTEVTVENLVLMKSSDNDIIAPEKPKDEPIWVDKDSEENIWNTANPKLLSCHYAPEWNKIDDPEVTINNGEITISLPFATKERWQAQIPFELELAIDDVESEYDFLAVIESNAAFKPMVKLTDANDDDNFMFADDSKALVEGGELRFVQSKVKLGSPCEAMKLFFDFGGNPANTQIKISNIILQKHKD